MFREMEQQEAEGQSPYAMHVDALLDRFSALVEHAQALVFPPLRKGVTAPLDMMGWSRFRRLAYRISSPLPTNFGAETFSYYTPIFAVWLTISIYWIHAANATLHVVFKGTPPATSSSVSAVWVDIMVWVIWVTMGVLTLASYWRWIEFFRDRRYPAYWRLILTLLFAAIVISFPNWGLDAEWRNLFSSRVLQDYRGLRQFVLISVLVLIPLGTFYYMLAVDTVVFGTWLLRATFEYLRSAHSPLPKDLIRELALEPIPSSRGERKGWRLTELAEAELESLRRWAAANREGTDKRLLPTAVLFGVLATFANTQTFNRAIDRVLVWSADSNSR